MKKIKDIFSWIMRDKKRTLVAVFVLSLIIFGIYKVAIPKNKSPQYQTSVVEKGTIVSSITASGTIISSNINNITTQASGTVKKVYISDGDEVKKGQVIAEIELDTQGAQNQAQAYSSYLSASIGLTSANNGYRSAQASAEKVLDDVKGHDADETFAQKETRTKAEVARDNAYDSIRLAVAKLTSAALDYQTNSPIITAPVSGIVKSVTIAEGMNLGTTESASGSRANQRVATIATGGMPIATFNVSEIDVSSIKPDQKASITLDSIPDTTFTGKVVSVDRVGAITNNVTTYPIIIKFDTTSDRILPNMAVAANIIIDLKSDVLVVPSVAIKTQAGQSTVTIMNNKQEQSVTVEVGLSNDTQSEIISGLQEGDVVVTGTVSTSLSGQSTTNTGRTIFSGGGGTRIPGAGAFRD